MGKRVAVIGASGFVGAAFVEEAIIDNEIEIVPIIHSSGNAWRLARHGLELRTANLLDKDSVGNALRGCSHVVNCSRGSNDVMLTGLHNVLDYATRAGTEGFLHLSSVMVYGDPPGADSTTESGPTPPLDKTGYAGVKQQQDQMVQRAATNLPALILCPPNIGGPYSYFLGGIIDSLRVGSLGLLDDGAAVCNIVDVSNLVHAMRQGLDHCSRHAPRLFITDDEDVTWKHVVEGVLPLCEGASPPPSIERNELTQLRRSLYAHPKISIVRSLKHLVSSDVRSAMRKDALWAKVDGIFRQGVAKFGAAFEDRMRLAVEGPLQVAKARSVRAINVPLSIQQLRGVRHSCAKAKTTIGYKPQHSFAESMKAYRAWYRSHTGQNSPSWELSRYLWQ